MDDLRVHEHTYVRMLLWKGRGSAMSPNWFFHQRSILCRVHKLPLWFGDRMTWKQFFTWLNSTSQDFCFKVPSWWFFETQTAYAFISSAQDVFMSENIRLIWFDDLVENVAQCCLLKELFAVPTAAREIAACLGNVIDNTFLCNCNYGNVKYTDEHRYEISRNFTYYCIATESYVRTALCMAVNLRRTKLKCIISRKMARRYTI